MGFGGKAHKKFLKPMPLNWAVNVTKTLFIITVVPGRDEEMVTLLPYFATIQKTHVCGQKLKVWLNCERVFGSGCDTPPISSLCAGLLYSIAYIVINLRNFTSLSASLP